ncbi:MAG TPA: bifunctional serine/threonine-protein kinase/formylglycine-generating enzyme family protein, partial [Thermomonas sp.]|nr:bifunctional serine/threonine-protein kinase/formylglycine-generating enzyme family protein [Thermomonas sp.]
SSNEHPQIDGYRILRVVGHGGMSTVYLAEQASLGRKVALKVMLPEALADEVSRARFENEARIIARLEHPNIVGIYEVGRTVDGLPFYSMPFLSRGHLAQRNLRGDQQQAAAILRALLPALDYAHVRGVVHRDVKAENVLFDDAERPQLADFGIALRRGNNPRLTSTGLAVGSTAYMPPEQARGGEVDRRADIYSIGVLTWEMLTGRLPFNAGDALSMALKHVQDPIPRLPSPLKHWQGFIDKAMAKQPTERFASAQDMLDALAELERRAGRNFGFVGLPPAVDDDMGTPRPSGLGWKPWAFAAATVALLAFGVTYLMDGGGNGSLAMPPATTGVDAPAAGNTLPAPAADAQTGLFDGAPAADASGIGAYLANAEQQLREGHLLAPPNGNAWDSLDAAWRVDATHPQSQMLTARLFDALAELGERSLRNGDLGSARTAFERARQLDARRGGDGSAIALLRKRLDAALVTRLDMLVARQDRAGADTLLAGTRWLGLDAARTQSLQARVEGVAKATVTTVASTSVKPATSADVDVRTISRGDYARFVADTARASADCGRNGLFGGKREWKTTGNDGAPVVCVSAADAQAYAAWLSSREKKRYRLPSAGELRAQATTPVSGWLTLCADGGCRRRMASGKVRALDANRGYADIGIRLVREG